MNKTMMGVENHLNMGNRNNSNMMLLATATYSACVCNLVV